MIKVHSYNVRGPECQKRPTIGAKETYYMRTFERCGPTIWAKETYYRGNSDLLQGQKICGRLRGVDLLYAPRVSKETYYRGKRDLLYADF